MLKRRFDTEKELRNYLGSVLPIRVTKKVTLFKGEILLTEELCELLRGYLGTRYYPADAYRLLIDASWSWHSLVLLTSLSILVETPKVDKLLTSELLECITDLG